MTVDDAYVNIVPLTAVCSDRHGLRGLLRVIHRVLGAVVRRPIWMLVLLWGFDGAVQCCGDEAPPEIRQHHPSGNTILRVKCEDFCHKSGIQCRDGAYGDLLVGALEKGLRAMLR